MNVVSPSSEAHFVDQAAFGALRQELGGNVARMVGYFKEDGEKSIRLLEEAARARNAVALVRPAHTLKGDALQFGATALAAVAETIEMAARQAVEDRVYPNEVMAEVLRLRPLFEGTAAALAREVAPSPALPRRVVGFGRKAPARF